MSGIQNGQIQPEVSMVSVKSLSKAFGAAVVLSDINFNLERGKVHSIIGPNGAGKTTLLNILSGLYRPSSGEVIIDGTHVNGFAPHRLAALGVSRTFQNLKVCFSLSLVENVMLGQHRHLPNGILAGILRSQATRRADERARAEATELLAFAGVPVDGALMPGMLSFGALKRLEIARALAGRPRLLLLDEPAAGLNPQETEEVKELIEKLARRSITVVLVEHDMKLVMAVSHNVVVLNYGRKIALGTPAEVSCNSDVITAYLGTRRVRDAQEALA